MARIAQTTPGVLGYVIKGLGITVFDTVSLPGSIADAVTLRALTMIVGIRIWNAGWDLLPPCFHFWREDTCSSISTEADRDRRVALRYA